MDGGKTATAAPVASVKGVKTTTHTPLRVYMTRSKKRHREKRQKKKKKRKKTKVQRCVHKTTDVHDSVVSVDGGKTAAAAPVASVDGGKTATTTPVASVDGDKTITTTPVASVDGGNPTTSYPIASVDGDNNATHDPVASVDGGKTTTTTPVASVDGGKTTTTTPVASVDGDNATTAAPVTSVDGDKTATHAPVASVGGGRTATHASIREYSTRSKGTVFLPQKKVEVQRKKRPRMIPPEYPGLYADEQGGMLLPDPNAKQKQLPLTRKESESLRRDKRPRHAVKLGDKMIYQVRAWVDDTGHWYYEGRSYNSNKPEKVYASWLTRNNMNFVWRKRTIMYNQLYWYRCRVLSPEGGRRPGCVPLSVIMFYEHVGMFDRATELRRRWHNGFTSWGKVVNFIRNAKGFTFKKLSCPDFTKNLLVLGRQKCLFVIQISAVNLTDYKDTDNLHAISVFNGLIFDANHEHPLPLTKDNLDECCLGGPLWVFHHVSRVRQFIPTAKTAKYIKNFISTS